MKKLKYLALALGFIPALTTTSNAASFNCAKASTPNEIAICSDKELSQLDEIMAANYKSERNSTPDPDKLKKEQINWIKSINTCDGETNCLIEAYKNRLRVLDYLDGTVTLAPDPLADRILSLDQREKDLARREVSILRKEQELKEEMDKLLEQSNAFDQKKKTTFNDSSNHVPFVGTATCENDAGGVHTYEIDRSGMLNTLVTSTVNGLKSTYSPNLFEYVKKNDGKVINYGKFDDFFDVLNNSQIMVLGGKPSKIASCVFKVDNSVDLQEQRELHEQESEKLASDMAQLDENYTKLDHKCLSGVVSTGEKISFSKCVGFVNLINSKLGQPLTFPDGPGQFGWDVDRTCSYLSEGKSQNDHLMWGEVSAGSGLMSQNVEGMKEIVNACNQLWDYHFTQSGY